MAKGTLPRSHAHFQTHSSRLSEAIPYHLFMTDWPALFFDTRANWPERLARRARQRFVDTADAEAAYNYAFERISANEWQRLRSGFTARGKPEGFLAITFIHLLEEYAVRKYGRVRPPTWLRRLGPAWERIYRLLCLKRQPPESIVERLAPDTDMTAPELRHAIREIRGRVVDCGRHFGEIADADVPAAAETPDPGPPEALEREDVIAVLEVLRGLLHTQPGQDHNLGHPASTRPVIQRYLPEVRAALSLSDSERLLLKLVYLEGYSIARAARVQRMPVHRVRRLHKRLVVGIGKALAPLGFDEE